MPYTIQFENEDRGVIITWTDVVQGEELLTANTEIYRLDKQNRIRYQIWDFSQADNINIDDEQIRRSAMQDSVAAKTNPDQFVAIVGSDLILAGSNRIYKIYAEIWCGFESETFSSVADAHRWVAQQMG